jgi:hypothetical protein
MEGNSIVDRIVISGQIRNRSKMSVTMGPILCRDQQKAKASIRDNRGALINDFH